MVTLALNLSGQSVHIRNLGKGLIARGHEVRVAAGDLAAGKPLGQEYFAEAGIEGIQLPVANLAAGVKTFARQSMQGGLALRKLVRRHRVDVIHLHAVTLAAQAQAARMLMLRPPALVTTFNNQLILDHKRKLGQMACRMFRYPLGRRVVVMSSDMAKLIHSEISVPEALVRTISCSVDDGYFVPPTAAQRADARRELALNENEVAVCCVARLETRKNQSRLIQAIAALRRRGMPVRLLLAGDDIAGHQRELQELADREQCATAVSFLGFRDPRLVMWASDINALVSTEEGFGLVVIEGAMTGLPPLRSRSAGAEDQVQDGKTGLLVDATSTPEMASCIERLAVDPAYRRAIGDAANASARENYSLRVMARQAEEVYMEASGRSD